METHFFKLVSQLQNYVLNYQWYVVYFYVLSQFNLETLKGIQVN